MSKFYAHRYFLIKPYQESLFNTIEKHEVMKNLINKLKNEQLWSKDKKYVLYYTKKLYEKTYLLKLGKQITKKKYLPEQKDIYEIKESDNYPYVYILFNIDDNQQIFLIEKNTSIFKDVGDSIKRLTDIIKTSVRVQGYEIKIEPITFDNVFWKCVNEAEGLNEIEIQLNSPNLFGASFKTNRFLEILKKIYNNDTFSFKLSNEENNLKIDKEDMNDTIKYIGEGGGRWKIKGRFNGQEETISSINEKNIKKVNIDIEKEDPSKIKGKVIQLDNFFRKNKK